MKLEQLESFLTEQGFVKISSNIPEISFFFREENAFVNVLHVIDYKPNLYFTTDEFSYLKETIRNLFRAKGVKEIHILSLIIGADMRKAEQLCMEDSFSWMISPISNQLFIFEDKVEDFYGMKKLLEDFLYQVSHPTLTEEELKQEAVKAKEALRKFSWKNKDFAWVNLLLIFVNAILFIICTFTGNLLYNKGALNTMYVMQNGEWYRLFTCMFLHVDISHLVSNMLVLYYIGNAVEKQIGHLPYTIVYFLSGIIGCIFSMGYELLTNDFVSSVGASGAVFGVEGALLMLVLLYRGRWKDVTIGRVAFVIGFSLYCGFTSSHVNNAAHIGGVLMGFVLTGILWLLIPRLRNQQKRGNLFP